MVKESRALFDKYSYLDDEFLHFREIVIEQRKPRAIFVQANLSLTVFGWFSISLSNLGGEWGQSSLWGHNDGRILAVLCYHAQLHQAQHWRVLGSSFIRSRCKSFCCLQKWLFFVWILFCSLFNHSTHTFLLWSRMWMNWKWIWILTIVYFLSDQFWRCQIL